MGLSEGMCVKSVQVHKFLCNILFPYMYLCSDMTCSLVGQACPMFLEDTLEYIYIYILCPKCSINYYIQYKLIMVHTKKNYKLKFVFACKNVSPVPQTVVKGKKIYLGNK